MSVNDTGVSPSGLPVSGPGSPAGWSRRFAALIVDWALANVVAFALAGSSVWDASGGRTWVPLVCWLVMVWLATTLTGASPGQWVLGVRIVRLDRRRIGAVKAAVRTALIGLVIPPLIFDREGRGLHDLAVGTAAVRGPGRT